MTEPTPSAEPASRGPARSARYGPSEPEGHLDDGTPRSGVSECTVEVTRALQGSVASVRSMDIATRPGLWIAAGIVAALVGLWLGLTGRAPLTTLGLAVLAGALVVLLGFRNCHRVARRVFPRGDQMTARLDQSGLTLTVRKGSFHAAWTDFHSVDVAREHLILRMRGSAAAIVLPPELLTADAQHIAEDGIAAASQRA